MKNERFMLERVTRDGEDFSRRRFGYFCAIASSFHRCSFAATEMGDACFGGGTSVSEYVECSFDRAKIHAVAPGVARFVRCSFRDCVIREFFGSYVELIDCVFSGRIQGAVFWGSIHDTDRTAMIGRAKNEFYGNDFGNAVLADVAFRGGIDLSKQVLPVGPNYLHLPRAVDVVAEVRRSVVTWRDLDLRRNALAIIKEMEMDLDSGQEQLFVERHTGPANLRKAEQLIFDALRHAASMA